MIASFIGRMMNDGRGLGRAGRAHGGAFRVMMIAAFLSSGVAAAAPPILYRTPGLQSPVRGGPKDLLLLAGANLAANDTVILRALDSGLVIAEPEVIREVSAADALVIRLPAELDVNRAYSIAVMNRSGEISEPVTINEAKPLWFVPGTLPTDGAAPGLKREMKIVGRNLAPVGIQFTQVRLRGPRQVTIAAAPNPRAPQIDEFVARVALPALPAGNYQVDVSRDGKRWTNVESTLRVVAARAPSATFAMSDVAFGGCRPDDDADDTKCIIAAIAAAQRAGGGTVRFGAGLWRLDNADTPGIYAGEGIWVPRRVNLVGTSTRSAKLRRGASWQRSRSAATFVLMGDNTVSGLTFSDDTHTRTAKDDPAFLQLGRIWYHASSVTAERVTAEISITNNLFGGAAVAIRTGGLPMERLIITGNTLRAYRLALALGGDANNVRDTFRIADSVITGNIFEPGSYLDVAAVQGARAAELGAGQRVDFSANTADGTATAGLDAPGDARGWRAAFFWHLQGPQEQLLVSDNDVRCSGDKAGDGEAIALDNNHNTFALDALRRVLDADLQHVSVLGPVVSRQGKHAVDIATYYVGHWLQITDGPGVGQSRRIVAVDYDSQRRRTTFTVAPSWDVVPAARESRIAVGRSFFQTYVVANRVDHRQPLCLKSNRNGPRGGGISLWAQTSDSVVAFNRQYDTDGISFQQLSAPGVTNFQAVLEIRRNTIVGEYAAGHIGSRFGIQGSHGASPEAVPPTASFGLVIAENHISATDGAVGAAISFPATWHRGPAPNDWPLIDRALIYKNNITGGAVGLELGADSLARRTVLQANRCTAVARKLRIGAPQTFTLCSPRNAAYCECAISN